MSLQRTGELIFSAKADINSALYQALRAMERRSDYPLMRERLLKTLDLLHQADLQVRQALQEEVEPTAEPNFSDRDAVRDVPF